MFCKVFLVLTLAAAAAVSSLECAFEVLASSSNVDIEKEVEKCESGDKYCITINDNGITAKGCSKTAGKICYQAGCDSENTYCCCEGNMCNGVSGMSVVLPVVILGVAKMFL